VTVFNIYCGYSLEGLYLKLLIYNSTLFMGKSHLNHKQTFKK